MAKSRTDVESVVKLIINGEQAKTSMKEITDALRKYEAEIKNMKQADNPQAYREKAAAIQEMRQALKAARDEIAGVNEESKNFLTNWFEIAKGVVAGNIFEDVIGSVKDYAIQIKDAYAETAKFRAILTNTFKGNEELAGKALKMLQDFAASTPYQLQEATEGYIKLVNRGIIPTQAELVKIGDLAASQGKSLDQYIEAILDAQTGEFERLKEFGIRASKDGDKVTLSFKGVTKEVQNTENAIKDALLAFGDMDGVRNSMNVVSEQLVGLESNIEDSWSQIFTKIGQSSEGFIFGIYKTYASVLDFVNQRILGTKTASDSLTEEWISQAEKVQSLEQNTTPLINRYDQLLSKGKLNKKEQGELKDIIGQLASIMPSAVTEFDKYGKALGINTSKAREFIAVQKELMKFQNQEAIKQTEKEIKDLEKLQSNLQFRLKDRRTTESAIGGFSGGPGGTGISSRDLTDQEIADLQKRLNATTTDLEQKQRLLKGLNGGMLDEVKKIREEATKLDTSAFEITNTGVTKVNEALVKKLQKEKDDLKKAVDSLEQDAFISNLEGLPKLLAEIEKKYDPLIEKAERLKDATSLETLKTLKQGEVDKTTEEFNKSSAQESIETDKDLYRVQTKQINDEFTQKQKALDDQFADKDPETNADSEKLKAEYDQQLFDLENQRLLALQMLTQAYGESDLDYQRDLSQRKLEQKRKEVDQRKQLAEGERAIEEATLQNMAAGVGVLKGLVNQRGAAFKALLIAEKAIAISQVIVNMQKEISGYYAAYAAIPGGVAIASGLATTAKIRAGISIATIAIQGVKEWSSSGGSDRPESTADRSRSGRPERKYATGGFSGVPDGPSHASGGIKMIDAITGAVIGEMEGGEPILSRETYRNNKQTIDALLYSSQRRNGAAINISTSSVLDAERYYRTGGITSTTAPDSSPAPVSTTTYMGSDNTDLIAVQKELLSEFKKFSGKPWEFPMKQFYDADAKNKRISNNATA